jgi:hypothetical protein
MMLFRESIRCRACGHEWTGYLHGFSRGHAVLVSGERVAFIPDDLLYAFPEHVSLGHDFAALLVALGWRHMESCPACGTADFVGAYNQQAMVEVPFIQFDENDFIPTATGWTLSERANDKIRNG